MIRDWKLTLNTIFHFPWQTKMFYFCHHDANLAYFYWQCCAAAVAVSSFQHCSVGFFLFSCLLFKVTPKLKSRFLVVNLCVHHLWLSVSCLFRWERPPGALHIGLGPDASVCVPPQALSVGSKSLRLLLLSSHIFPLAASSQHDTQPLSCSSGLSSLH